MPRDVTRHPHRRKAPRRRARPRRRAHPGFWHTPTGRVAGGVVVLVLLAVAVGVYDRARDYSAPPHAALPAAKPPAADAPVPAAPRPPLSYDPVAPLPHADAWRKNAVASAPPDGRPMIAIVIDDVGLDRQRSRRAIALPAPVTIAVMAYAQDVRAQAAAAHRAGHELLVHLPMEPDDAREDPGPNALRDDLSPAELNRRIEWNLSRFGGYVGVNNHMGSRMTSDASALAPLMAALKQRGLLFLDSRTSPHTKGLAVARRFGVPAVERNVFLDNDTSPIALRAALVQTEDVAQRNGFAIAIGHPKDATLDALEEWLPDAMARGFAVVPLSAILRYGGGAAG